MKIFIQPTSETKRGDCHPSGPYAKPADGRQVVDKHIRVKSVLWHSQAYRHRSAVEPLQMGPIREGVPSSCIAGKGSKASGYPENLAIWLLPYPLPADLASHYLVSALHLLGRAQTGLPKACPSSQVSSRPLGEGQRFQPTTNFSHAGPITSWEIDEETVETVLDFMFLVSCC